MNILLYEDNDYNVEEEEEDNDTNDWCFGN